MSILVPMREIVATPAQQALRTQISQHGYVVLRQAIDPAIIAALHDDLRDRFEKTPYCQGDFYGARTKRFGGVLKRSAHAASLVMHADILAIAELVLGPHCERVQLNLTQALEIHPGETVQAPHRDQDMYWGPKGVTEYLINVMWPFTPYTSENGATLVYPGSNRLLHLGVEDFAEPVAVEMAPGDVLVFLGSTLHGAGANRSSAARTGLIVGYSLGWLKPYENQWLAYPPEVARGFPKELADLVGYACHRPNLGNFEGQCPSVALDPSHGEYLPATDVMTVEQTARLKAFKERQKASNAA